MATTGRAIVDGQIGPEIPVSDHYHDFLLYGDGEPKIELLEMIPEVRERIDSMSSLTARFCKNDVTDRVKFLSDDRVMEFCGSWRFPLSLFCVGEDKTIEYVNPSYKYASRFSDVYTRCYCDGDYIYQGSYENVRESAEGHGEHDEYCKAYDRLRARADLLEKREHILRYCTAMGWTGSNVMTRLGFSSRSSSGYLARELSTTTWELQNEYKRLAGNTYHLLVHEHGIPAQIVSDAYGRNMTTMGRYYNNHGDKDVVSNNS